MFQKREVKPCLYMRASMQHQSGHGNQFLSLAGLGFSAWLGLGPCAWHLSKQDSERSLSSHESVGLSVLDARV